MEKHFALDMPLVQIHGSSMSPANILVEISAPLEATLDIIVVHGMNLRGNERHEENTWTHQSTGTNWVRTLLPERTPNANIFAFHYNANVAFGPSIAGVTGQARNLLECLRLKRELNATRPIIWIAHSLGGTIVKEALVIAFDEFRAYPLISSFTYAIFFMAVPHRGSSWATWGKVTSDIYRTFAMEPKNSFLESVTKNSEYNDDLNTRFEPLHRLYRFYSWIEGRPTLGTDLIVPKQSATLGLLVPHETCRTAERDHITICKFSGAKDPEWLELAAHIDEAARAATSSFDYSPTVDRRQNLFRMSQYDVQYMNSPEDAIKEAQNAIKSMDMFYGGTELCGREREAQGAVDAATSLVRLLLTVISPLLDFLDAFTFSTVLAAILLTPILALLPDKNELSGHAKKGKEAGEKIMEMEEWAIGMLNSNQHDALRALYHLQQAINAAQLQDPDHTQALQLIQAHCLQEHLFQRVERSTLDMHERQRKYKKAEYAVGRIEKVEKEVEDKDNKDTYMVMTREAREIKEELSMCPNCIIL